jgi:transposase
VHDGWRPYWQFLCHHALCNVHHLRDLTFLDVGKLQPWAGEMKVLFLDSKAAVRQA